MLAAESFDEIADLMSSRSATDDLQHLSDQFSLVPDSSLEDCTSPFSLSLFHWMSLATSTPRLIQRSWPRNQLSSTARGPFQWCQPDVCHRRTPKRDGACAEGAGIGPRNVHHLA